MSVKLKNILDLIEECQTEMDNLIKIMEQKENEFITYPEPASQEKYDSLFNDIENAKRTVDYYEKSSIKILEVVNNYHKTIQTAKKSNDKLYISLNKNKFNYGLQGQLKKIIENSHLDQELTEEIKEIMEQGYTLTP